MVLRANTEVTGNLKVDGSLSAAGAVTPYYAIGSQTNTDYSTASTALVEVDSTNLKIVTAVVPASSSIRVRAIVCVNTVVGAVDFQIAIGDSVAGAVAVSQGRGPAAGASIPVYVEAVYAAGDGLAHTFTLQFRTTNASDAVHILNGPNGEPFPLMICEVNQ